MAASPSSLPGGWRAITPPWQGVVSDPSLERYVVSHDIPGLVVACAGHSTASPDQELSGTAYLWRSRDGGAHWRKLVATMLLDSCADLTMITGSSGLLVTSGTIEAGSGTGTLLVSPDAGDTWKTVSSFFPGEIAANRLIAMQQAVYRDGRLYASLIFNAAITRLFSVSNDDGLTWITLDQVPSPAAGEVPLLTEDFAPDYRAPHAWFRYALHGPLNMSLPHYTTFDRSTDDGRTWTPLTRLDAGAAELPQNGQPLVSSAQQPSRLCVGLTVPVTLPGERFPASDLVLGASDDAGMTWHYTRLSHIQQDERTGDPEPLMDAQGNCYVTVAPSGSGFMRDPGASTDSTILRLAPGGGAQPEVVATLVRQFAGLVAVFPTAQPNQLALSVVSVPIPATGGIIDYNVVRLLVASTPS